MQSGLVPYAHISHARAILSVLCIVTHSFTTHIDLCTVRVLHASRHAGGPAPWYLGFHDRLPNARPIVQPLPHPCGLLQANWALSDSSPARVTDGQFALGQPAFLHSPPVRCCSPGRSPSFTARQSGAVTRAEAHVVRLWSSASWCSFTAHRCGTVIQAKAHPFPAIIFSRPVFLHSPLVRCRSSGRSPSSSGRSVWRGRASSVGLPACTGIRHL